MDNRAAVQAKVQRIATAEVLRAAARTAQIADATAPRRTGYLASRIGHALEFVSDGIVAGIAFARAGYSGFVERGTARMSARPYLLPAYRIVSAEFLTRLRSKFSASSRRP